MYVYTNRQGIREVALVELQTQTHKEQVRISMNILHTQFYVITTVCVDASRW